MNIVDLPIELTREIFTLVDGKSSNYNEYKINYWKDKFELCLNVINRKKLEKYISKHIVSIKRNKKNYNFLNKKSNKEYRGLYFLFLKLYNNNEAKIIPWNGKYSSNDIGIEFFYRIDDEIIILNMDIEKFNNMKSNDKYNKPMLKKIWILSKILYNIKDFEIV